MADGVKYVGGADVRKLTVEDFKRAGVEEPVEAEWSALNDFLVPVEFLSFLDKEQFDRIIRADRGFKIVDLEAEAAAKEEAAAQAAQEAEAEEEES